MSQVMFIVRGIQGSGKSTFAQQWVAQKPLERARINRDDIRFTKFGSYVLPPELENVVTKIELNDIETLLKAGLSVVIDNMNLRPKYIKQYLKLAAKYNVAVLHRDFPIELKEALARNSTREKKVPEQVIKDTYARFIRKGAFVPFPSLEDDGLEYEPYIPDVSKPAAFLLDVDGTAMKISPERGPFDWSLVLLDEPNEPVVQTVKALHDAGYKIVVMSGRDSIAKADTIQSLTEAGIEFDALFMRGEGDQRPDWKVKGELFDANIRYNYNVIACLDDRDQVVDFYRKKLGLTVFQVDYGNF